ESLTIFRELDVFLEYPVASRVPAPTREFLESLGRGRHVKNIRRLEVPRPGRLPHAVCRRHGWRSVIVGRLGQGASLIEDKHEFQGLHLSERTALESDLRTPGSFQGIRYHPRVSERRGSLRSAAAERQGGRNRRERINSCSHETPVVVASRSNRIRWR